MKLSVFKYLELWLKSLVFPYRRIETRFCFVVVVVAKILWQYERLYLNWKSGSKEIGNCQNIGDCLNERPLFWLHLFFIYFCFFFHFSVNTSTYLLWLNVFFPSNLCCFKLLLCNTPVICNQRISLWFNNFSQNCLQIRLVEIKACPFIIFRLNKLLNSSTSPSFDLCYLVLS